MNKKPYNLFRNFQGNLPKPSMSRLFSTTTSSRESPTFPVVVSVSPSRFLKWTVILSSELRKEAVFQYF